VDEHSYETLELVGSSDQGIERAIDAALATAYDTADRHMRYFEVIDTTGQIRHGRITEYQVRIKVSFRLGEDPDIHHIDDIPEPYSDPLNDGP
jgi:flavin-binding protein dodecin